MNRPFILRAVPGIVLILASLAPGSSQTTSRKETLNKALIEAAKKGDTAKVKALLAKGASANADDGPGRTALTWAIARRHTSTALLLLDKGANPNGMPSRYRSTPLQLAVIRDNLPVVKALIKKGADVNYKVGIDGTCLILAARGASLPIVEALLKAGASVNVKGDRGRTALMTAAAFRQTEIVRALLAKGADVNAADEDGNTPLLMAVATMRPWMDFWGWEIDTEPEHDSKGGRGHRPPKLEIVRLLLDKGADVEAQNKKGKTAFKVATDMGYEDIVRLLKQAGAKE